MRGRDAGFTLSEVLVYLAIIAVALSMSGTIVVSLLDTSRAARHAADESRTVLTALERLGEDARRSVRVSAESGRRRSGESCLILDTCSGTRVVYVVEDHVLWREAERRVPLGRLDGLRFRYLNPAAEGAGFIEVEIERRGGPAARHRLYLMAEARP